MQQAGCIAKQGGQGRGDETQVHSGTRQCRKCHAASTPRTAITSGGYICGASSCSMRSWYSHRLSTWRKKVMGFWPRI